MTKETVRYADGVVGAVEDTVMSSVFDSKSEFYRFSAEYVLNLLNDEYEPVAFEYDEIIRELDIHTNGGHVHDGGGRDASDFVETLVRVRKHAYRDEFAAAEDAIDVAYSRTDTEAVLLEEILQLYRGAAES